MGSLVLASAVALVGMTVLLLRGPQQRGSTAFFLSVLPFALLLPIVPLGPFGMSFIHAFQDLATRGQGGTRFIAGICLANSLLIYYGLLGSLLIILLAAAAPVIGRNRHASCPPAVPYVPSWAPTVAGWVLVLLAALLLHQARRLAAVTMFVVDPEKNAEAEVVFQGMNLSDVSNMIATKAILVTIGGFAISLLLLGVGVFNIIMARSIAHSRRARIGAWCLFVGVLISGGLEVTRLSADLHWFESVLHRE